MLIVFCGKHPEYEPTKAPENCSTCELIYVLVCRDNKYYKGASSFNAYYSRLTEEDFKNAVAGLGIFAAGVL